MYGHPPPQAATRTRFRAIAPSPNIPPGRTAPDTDRMNLADTADALKLDDTEDAVVGFRTEADQQADLARGARGRSADPTHLSILPGSTKNVSGGNSEQTPRLR
jgi:hypothetical protein